MAGALPAATGSRGDSAMSEHSSRRSFAITVSLVPSTKNTYVRRARSVYPLTWARCSGIIQSFHAQHLYIQVLLLVVTMCR